MQLLAWILQPDWLQFWLPELTSNYPKWQPKLTSQSELRPTYVRVTVLPMGPLRMKNTQNNFKFYK